MLSTQFSQHKITHRKYKPVIITQSATSSYKHDKDFNAGSLSGYANESWVVVFFLMYSMNAMKSKMEKALTY